MSNHGRAVLGERAVAEKEQRIFFDQLWAEFSDAGDRDLRIAELGECRHRGDVEAGAVQSRDPVDLVDRSQAFYRLDGLWRLRAVVVFDQLDLALPVFEFQAAILVDLLCPQPPRREMSDRRAWRERAGFWADHSDFDDCLIRLSRHERMVQPAPWRRHISASRVCAFQTSLEVLACPGIVAPSFVGTRTRAAWRLCAVSVYIAQNNVIRDMAHGHSRPWAATARCGERGTWANAVGGAMLIVQPPRMAGPSLHIGVRPLRNNEWRRPPSRSQAEAKPKKFVAEVHIPI